MTIYVPRVFGGTLIITVGPPPPSVLPVLVVTATFRDGKTTVVHRDGKTTATHRDGIVTTGGR